MADGITSIGSEVFEFCYSLTSLTIPGTVTNIGAHAFFNCTNLTNITVSDGVTSMAWPGAFVGCTGLATVAIPQSVTNVGSRPFEACESLTAIMVDAGNLFYSSVNGALFDKSQTTLIEYPPGLGGSYTIPGSVTTIGASAFLECHDLSKITIPSSVTNIGSNAFDECYDLTNVYFEGSAPAVGSTEFTDDNNVTVYYLPGTIGWSSTFADSPALLWNPMIQTGGGFGVLSNQFGFNISGTTNIPIMVEAATDLSSSGWTPLQALTVTNGSVYFTDPQWTNYPGRFYRISSP